MFESRRGAKRYIHKKTRMKMDYINGNKFGLKVIDPSKFVENCCLGFSFTNIDQSKI